MEKEDIVRALNERLEEHDENRKAVQSSLMEICNERRRQIDGVESGVAKELEEKFAEESRRLETVLNELKMAGDDKDGALTSGTGHAALLAVQSYKIKEQQDEESPLVLSTKLRKVDCPACTSTEALVDALSRQASDHDESRREACESLAERCNEFRKQVDALGERVNEELGAKYTCEDSRLQCLLAKLRGAGAPKEVAKAKAELVLRQTYELQKREGAAGFSEAYELVTRKEVDPEMLEKDRPGPPKFCKSVCGRIYLEFAALNDDEERVLARNGIGVSYEASMTKDPSSGPAVFGLVKHGKASFSFLAGTLSAGAVYSVRARAVFAGKEGRWSDAAELATPEFGACCVWKESPRAGDYRVEEGAQTVATGVGSCWHTVVGTASLPAGKETGWGIKVLGSRAGGELFVFVGVAPFDVNQSSFNLYVCGWYLDCGRSALVSGPPHRYRNKEYGPRKKGSGEYVRLGDTVGVVMDTARGELSYALEGVNLGVAYSGIPLDKPLVPCVILGYEGCSIEFIPNFNKSK